MKIYGISTGYPAGVVHVIWDIPHDKINSYQLYRDGVLIADSTNPEQAKLFQTPTLFDHDHGTNLFKKNTKHQLIYSDTNNVQHYQKYEYHVIAKAINKDGIVTDDITSDILFITALQEVL